MSKKAQKQIISSFVNSVELNTPIDVSTFIDILKKHPNYEQKTLGLKHWYVGMNMFNKRGLYIMYENGNTDGFSYTCCIDPPTPRKDFITALRFEVYDQIKTVKDAMHATFECPICFKTVSKSQCHIDHIHPFKLIMNDWCILNNINIEDPPLLHHRGPIISLQNRELALNWYDYHKHHAKLQPLCAPCNLRKSAKIEARPSKVSRCLIE
jgi:5-methylcytosine-specific restriction endonuclease McrA